MRLARNLEFVANTFLLGNSGTGDELIIARRRGSTLRHNILRGPAKPPTSTGETILFRD